MTQVEGPSGPLVLPVEHLSELLEVDQPVAPEHHRQGCLLDFGLLEAQIEGAVAETDLVAQVLQQR